MNPPPPLPKLGFLQRRVPTAPYFLSPLCDKSGEYGDADAGASGEGEEEGDGDGARAAAFVVPQYACQRKTPMKHHNHEVCSACFLRGCGECICRGTGDGGRGAERGEGDGAGAGDSDTGVFCGLGRSREIVEGGVARVCIILWVRVSTP